MSKQEIMRRADSMPIRNMDDLGRLAKMFAQSGYFSDAKDAAQIGVKVLAGREMGFGAFASVNGVHIIQGRPSMGANLMAAAVKASGKYDYRVTTMQDDVVEIEFYQHGESLGVSRFDAEDAEKAGTKNLGKFPRNMLFARAMSNGVRWYCPDVFMGSAVYTPEELGAEVDAEGEVLDVESAVEAPSKVEPAPAPEPEPEAPAEAPAKPSQSARRKAEDDDPLTEASAKRLAEKLQSIGVEGDEQTKIVKQATGREVTLFTDLTQAEARAVWAKANGEPEGVPA